MWSDFELIMLLDKDGFDRWAGDYDESISPRSKGFPFEGYYNVLAVVHSLAGPRPGMTVLDVGIGTALLSTEFAKKGCRVFGIDFSSEMLKRAAARIPGGKFDLVDIAKDHLGRFNGTRFDRIVSSYFFHHLDSRQKIDFIKRSISENLNTDGMIIVADIGFSDKCAYEKAHESHKDAWDEAEHYMCGDEIKEDLTSHGIRSDYTQISSCAGVLAIQCKQATVINRY